MMPPTWTEMTLVLLDQVLGEKWGGDKVANLRTIERAARRMADQIERRAKTENRPVMERAPYRGDKPPL